MVRENEKDKSEVENDVSVLLHLLSKQNKRGWLAAQYNCRLSFLLFSFPIKEKGLYRKKE